MRKFTESLSNIKKVDAETLVYYDLFPLLRGLEVERPGIKNRVWRFVCDEQDVAFAPYNGRILNINLFFFGVGDEYPIPGVNEEELDHSKKTFPASFKDYMGTGTGDQKDIELRLDLNLIWYVYEVEDPEKFSVITQW